MDPYDIDSYVLTALAYAEVQRYAEARAQLEIVKNMTADLRIIEKLDSYLEKLDQQGQYYVPPKYSKVIYNLTRLYF